MKSLLKIIYLITVLILIGCNIVYENLVMDYFNPDSKAITIVEGTDPLIFGMKDIFINNDWEVQTFDSDEDQSSISVSSIDTRYLMLSEYEEGYDLINGPFVKEYEFTIYDTKSSSEVVIMYGSQRTVDQVLDEFRTIIEGNYE